jgi:hypothetical protein
MADIRMPHLPANVMLRAENLFHGPRGQCLSKETAERFKLAIFNLL